MVLANKSTSRVPHLKVMYLAYLASRYINSNILREEHVRFEILEFFQSPLHTWSSTKFHRFAGIWNFHTNWPKFQICGVRNLKINFPIVVTSQSQRDHFK